jgi:hypothetical protein
VDSADRLRAQIAFWLRGLDTIERQPVKGYGWVNGYLSLHGYIGDALRQLRDLGEL